MALTPTRLLVLACSLFSILNIRIACAQLGRLLSSLTARSESHCQSVRLIIQAEEHFKQARGSVLPRHRWLGLLFSGASDTLQSKGE